MDWPSFLGGGAVIGILGGSARWIIDNPDKTKAICSTLAGYFSWFSQSATRKQVSADIESVVLSVQKEAELLAPGVLPYELQVKWVLPGSTNVDSFRDEGKVVVRLRHHHNRAKNLVAAAVYYGENCIPNQIERCVSHLWREPLQLTIASKILAKGGREAFDEFHKSILEPRFLNNEYLQPRCTALQSVDRCGFFMRILMFEIHQLGLEHSLSTPEVSLLQETGAFIDFLSNVAERREGEDVELSFIRDNIKTGILFVARPENLTTYGLEPYIKRINTYYRNGARICYLCGRGNHIEAVNALTRIIKSNPKVAIVNIAEYKVEVEDRHHNGLRAACVRITFER